ncbi:DUF6476 family protein [Roseivivax marinus]|uniref:DUF6476 family protein n=1 Tax=Roseivivax marinus TaxID=1379903 RepID=UPI00273F9E06|nr:DUF6476 family protein [Roseivivax marinus]
MDDTPDPAPSPDVKFLKWLVTTLAAVMICGVLAVVIVLVIRLQPTPPPLPSEITLPDGARATAVTQGDDWIAIVTEAEEILVYDRLTGRLRQRVQIAPQDAATR